MAHASYLIVPDFFERAFCARVRRAMDDGLVEAAEVLDAIDDGVAATHVETVRHAASIELEPALLDVLEARLDTTRARVAVALGLPVSIREGCNVLRYPDGGFYRPHRDYAPNSSWPGAARRRIAIVVFLNTSRDRDPAGDFTGGTLRLWDHETPHDITPTAGTLVAFPATMLHEVVIVRDGIRDTVVDWWY